MDKKDEVYFPIAVDVFPGQNTPSWAAEARRDASSSEFWRVFWETLFYSAEQVTSLRGFGYIWNAPLSYAIRRNKHKGGVNS